MTTSSGMVVSGSTARYKPFGGYRTQPSQTITDRGFTGHLHNDSVGLVYMNARFYLPGVGRFASADTMIPNPANPQAFNRYSYVYNNPLNLVDLNGHEPISYALSFQQFGLFSNAIKNHYDDLSAFNKNADTYNATASWITGAGMSATTLGIALSPLSGGLSLGASFLLAACAAGIGYIAGDVYSEHQIAENKALLDDIAPLAEGLMRHIRIEDVKGENGEVERLISVVIPNKEAKNGEDVYKVNSINVVFDDQNLTVNFKFEVEVNGEIRWTQFYGDDNPKKLTQENYDLLKAYFESTGAN